MTGAILLYDGTCGFCARSVQFVLAHERRRHSLRFASLQSATGQAIRGRHPEVADVDSVIWVESAGGPESERTYARSSAVLRVMRYLGGGWSALAAVSAMVPRPLGDSVYNLVARHRHELAGSASCLVPTPDQRARFIDWEPATGASR
ncbi:MAG: thiol-disulfide oxidoreductase DCC family protein [Gemmatimonadaceae bacterium]